VFVRWFYNCLLATDLERLGIILTNINISVFLMPGIKSRMTHIFVKIRLFKTLTRTVLTCGCEIWELSISKKEKSFGTLFKEMS